MKKLSSNEIRNLWYKYFTEHGHLKVNSAPLVPIDDDSLLWINAGVTPLKKYFDGREVPESRRLCNVQKCIRTNDIENVGRTSRHCTFFEMMGNFSIGDYFRDEAISMAYELLTSKDYFAVPKDKLYVTVYIDDDDSFNKWVECGLDKDHIVRLKENFWEIGEGPCGPDSEIFFDRGEKYDTDGKAFEHFKKDEDQDRYVEIWNNVFSQFNAKKGQKRSEYEELPHKNIDTGAGLERWCCVFQGVDSNFETDLFKPIIKEIENISDVLYNDNMEFKVIADHSRALTMALADGAEFSNTGRGYVLRRLLRRSVRFGRKLGINEPFMYKLVKVVVSIMKDSYPNLEEEQKNVAKLIKDEEELFINTLSTGEKILNELISKNKKSKFISGKDVFKLQDTYGFPYELTLEYLEEAGYTTDTEEYSKYMDEQKKLAKNSRKNDSAMNVQNAAFMNFTKPSEFEYYVYSDKAKVVGLIKGDEEVESLSKDGYVILDKTIFYATSGGQVADTGMITNKDFKARVLDVAKGPNGQNIHKIKVLAGELKVGDSVSLVLDEDRRRKIECNHSSVHLLQLALQEVLGDEVKQAGSYVDENYLRFDFTYKGKIKDKEIIEAESHVNDYIKSQIERETDIMDIDSAKKTGAMALFSEKYGDKVRVVTFGNSKELCGGTHTSNTRNIGSFAITGLESKGSNVYRVFGATKDGIEKRLGEEIKPIEDEIVKYELKAKEIVSRANKDGYELKYKQSSSIISPSSYKDIIDAKKNLTKIQETVKELEKEYQSLMNKSALTNIDALYENVKPIKEGNLLVGQVSMDNDSCKELVDALFNKINKGLVILLNISNNKGLIVVRSNISIKANDVVKEVTSMLGGNGGGSPTFATGGFKETNKVNLTIIEEKYIK